MDNRERSVRLPRQLVRWFGTALLMIPTQFSLAADHYSKMVSLLQTPAAGYDCAFIRLEGVSVADPSVSPHAWIALPKTHNGYKEALATLHAAKLSGTPVNIGTTGPAICGDYAQMSYLYY